MLRLFSHARIRSLLLLITAFIAIGTALFMYLEAWTLEEAIYFSLSVVTTVGFGDMTPTHSASRIVASVYMALAIPLLMITVGVVADAIHDLRDKRR